MPVGRPGLEIVDFVDAHGQVSVCALEDVFDFERFGGSFCDRITAPACFEDSWAIPSGKCVVFFAMDLRLHC